MTVNFNPRQLPNGTVLVLGVRYLPYGSEPGGGSLRPNVYTYAALKTAGLWYLTGSGRVPTAAGWGAVESWLARDNRQLLFVDQFPEAGERIWTMPVDTLQA